MHLDTNIVSDELVVLKVKGIWCFELDAYICGTKVRLTFSEMRIFSLLLSNPEKIFFREMLVFARANDPYQYGRHLPESIDKFVAKIRKKIEIGTGYTQIILSEYGMGYHLNRHWYKAELNNRKAGQ